MTEKDDKYWTVVKYCKEEEYNNKYPFLAEVRLETGEVFVWRLPSIPEEQYNFMPNSKCEPEDFWKEVNHEGRR